MMVITNIEELSATIEQWKNEGLIIGFVPTMGALHEGHSSLLKLAQEKADRVVCSVFVNPTQFNEQSDFNLYPRTLERDLNLLKNTGCQLAFTPEVEGLYPDGNKTTKADYGQLTSSLEAMHRPGHFDGVVTVVRRLFQLVKPDLAFFGEKDFQQLAIIRQFVSAEKIDIRIIGCPIIREENGLAMSSRNRRLSTEGKERASLIYKTLGVSVFLAKSGYTIDEVKEIADRLFRSEPALEKEYFEIVAADSLKKAENLKPNIDYRVLCAVWLEGVRLIDNLHLSL